MRLNKKNLGWCFAIATTTILSSQNSYAFIDVIKGLAGDQVKGLVKGVACKGDDKKCAETALKTVKYAPGKCQTLVDSDWCAKYPKLGFQFIKACTKGGVDNCITKYVEAGHDPEVEPSEDSSAASAAEKPAAPAAAAAAPIMITKNDPSDPGYQVQTWNKIHPDNQFRSQIDLKAYLKANKSVNTQWSNGAKSEFMSHYNTCKNQKFTGVDTKGISCENKLG